MAIGTRVATLEADALDFAPAILQAQHAPPSPLPRLILYISLIFLSVLLAWAAFGRLDIVAVAQGKLVPQTFLKVVQPSDSGVVKEILVKEGDEVTEGQVLMRMDTSVSDADRKTLETDHQLKSLQLRRIDAELNGVAFAKRTSDDPRLFAQVEAQYRAHRQSYEDTLAGERAALDKAQHDLKGALEVEAKLRQTLPIYQDQEEGWNKLVNEGYAGRLLALDRTRARVENEGELRTQTSTVLSLRAAIEQSTKKILQITSTYRQQLNDERFDAESQHNKLGQELAKQTYKDGLLELRAPTAGRIKDLTTHTRGTVVSPGTVLLTLVPQNEPLQAEVWIANLDAGFIVPDQKAKLKLVAFPFQQYGMLDGVVRHVGADASDKADSSSNSVNGPAAPANADKDAGASSSQLFYRTLISLDSNELAVQGISHKLVPGMQVNAEIKLGTRTVLEYLISPVQKTINEAWRER